MDELVVVVVILPLLSGGLGLALGRRRQRLARAVTVGGALLGALAATGLLRLVGEEALVTFDWIPGAGPMSLGASSTGVYLTLVTAWSALLCLLVGTATGNFSRDESFPLAAAALCLFTVGSSVVAFLTDHFLARYVALEMTALCAVVVFIVGRPAPQAPRLAWRSYLLLRVGDAALVSGILMLLRGTGTMGIGPALEGAALLPPAQLSPLVIAILLAVWIKMGAIPFHAWLTRGIHLSWPVVALVYATIIPNLGGYLLYRISPLLLGLKPLSHTVAWLGATAALLAAGLALRQKDARRALLHVVAAQGGLALCVVGSGAPGPALSCLLGQAPSRLLLLLAAGGIPSSSCVRRILLTAALGLGGLISVGLTLQTVAWANIVSGSAVLLVAEVVAVLIVVSLVRVVLQLFRLYHDDLSPPAMTTARHRRATITLMTLALVAGWLAFDPLMHSLAHIMHLEGPPALAFPHLLRSLFTQPAPAVTLVLTFLYQLLIGWPPGSFFLEWLDEMRSALKQKIARFTLESVLFGLASNLRRVVERGTLERFNALVAQGVPALGREVHRVVEHGGLEWFNRWAAQGVPALGREVHRVVEHGGLERFNRWAAQGVPALGRWGHRVVEHGGLERVNRLVAQSARWLGEALRRLHSGRLRRNLLWGAISLAVLLFTLMLSRS